MHQKLAAILSFCKHAKKIEKSSSANINKDHQRIFYAKIGTFIHSVTIISLSHLMLGLGEVLGLGLCEELGLGEVLGLGLGEVLGLGLCEELGLGLGEVLELCGELRLEPESFKMTGGRITVHLKGRSHCGYAVPQINSDGCLLNRLQDYLLLYFAFQGTMLKGRCI